MQIMVSRWLLDAVVACLASKPYSLSNACVWSDQRRLYSKLLVRRLGSSGGRRKRVCRRQKYVVRQLDKWQTVIAVSYLLYTHTVACEIKAVLDWQSNLVVNQPCNWYILKNGINNIKPRRMAGRMSYRKSKSNFKDRLKNTLDLHVHLVQVTQQLHIRSVFKEIMENLEFYYVLNFWHSDHYCVFKDEAKVVHEAVDQLVPLVSKICNYILYLYSYAHWINSNNNKLLIFFFQPNFLMLTYHIKYQRRVVIRIILWGNHFQLLLFRTKLHIFHTWTSFR